MKEITIDGVVYAPKTEAQKGEQYCIVRTYSAGVWAGMIDPTIGKVNTVKNARRLWRWNSQFTLSELAELGVNKKDECKFAIEVPIVYLTEIIEIIPCSNKAITSICTQVVFIP